MKVMIFAAGMGTRLKLLTEDKPKALVHVAGVPLLERAVHYLKSFGITEMVINVHHFAGQIIEFLKSKNNFGITIHISDESNFLLDTGGGLKKAQHFLVGNDPVILYNVDIITNLDLFQLKDFHLANQALATLAVRRRDTQRYLLFNENLDLCGWRNIQTGETRWSRPVEESRVEQYAFSGIHIIQPEIFSQITEEGKFSMIDLYLRLAATQSIKAYIDTSDLWLDIGKQEQFADAENLIVQHYNRNSPGSF